MLAAKMPGERVLVECQVPLMPNLCRGESLSGYWWYINVISGNVRHAPVIFQRVVLTAACTVRQNVQVICFTGVCLKIPVTPVWQGKSNL